MKKRRVFLLTLCIFCLACNSMALENSIGGNAAIAAMGFAHVANNSSFYGNPAGFGESKIMLEMATTELYESGVFYNYIETAYRFHPNWKISLGFELVRDKDQIDNSGYNQKTSTMGIANKSIDRLQLGLNISQMKTELFNESIGYGYSLDFGMIYGPLLIGNYQLKFGAQLDDLASRREYKSKRKEIFEPTVSFGAGVSRSNIKYVINLKKDDFRCGFDYRIIPSVAIRMGVNNGEPTFGIGVIRKPIKINYACWLSNVGATHIFGSSILF